MLLLFVNRSVYMVYKQEADNTCFHGVGREESPYGYDICVVVRSEPPLSHRGSRGIDHASVDVRYGCGFGA